MTWGQFKNRFEKKFIPTSQKIALFKKFADLVRGDKFVAEYVNEFEALSKYGLSLIDTDEKKNDKFISGLNDALSAHLLDHVDDRFEKLVNMALIYEARFPKWN